MQEIVHNAIYGAGAAPKKFARLEAQQVDGDSLIFRSQTRVVF